MLNNNDKSGHPCHVPELNGKAVSFSPLRMIFTIGFSFLSIFLFYQLCSRSFLIFILRFMFYIAEIMLHMLGFFFSKSIPFPFSYFFPFFSPSPHLSATINKPLYLVFNIFPPLLDHLDHLHTYAQIHIY